MSNLDVERRGEALYLWLNRPERRNAFDPALLAELSAALKAAAADASVRALVLGGRGAAFCAGGDLKSWMPRAAELERADNRAETEALARLLHELYSFPKPVIARVHGDCYGGGVGLVAAADLAIATPTAAFALTEVRLGLIPATISPYVIRAMGARQASRYMLTAERFSGTEALSLGLVHALAEPEALDEAVSHWLAQLHAGGPEALRLTKKLIDAQPASRFGEDVIADTAARLAEVRVSSEAREGLAAFLERRKPGWASD
jgi:methylglutaconyl-CoA hydratase